MMTFMLPDPPERCGCGRVDFLRLGVERDGHVVWYFMCRECHALVPVSALLNV